jgi:hypothetical protein
MNTRTNRTKDARETFLQALGQCGNVTGSCEALSISRTQVYYWRNTDPEFARQWDEAVALGGEALEDECRRRAMAGSDALMVFMLRALKPEKYREKAAVDVTMRTAVDVRNMTADEIRARLAELRAEQGDPPMIESGNIIDLDAQR